MNIQLLTNIINKHNFDIAKFDYQNIILLLFFCEIFQISKDFSVGEI